MARRMRPTAASIGYGELAASLSLEVEVRLDMPRRQGGKAGHRPEPAAPRHPRQGIGRRGLRSGHAPARHAACPRRARPERRHEGEGGRYRGGRENAGRGEDRARRRLHGGHRRSRMARGEGIASPAGRRLGAHRAADPGIGPARDDPSSAGAGHADLRLSRPAVAGRRTQHPCALQPAAPDARLDRPLLRDGAVGERGHDGLDAQPGRLSAAQGAGRAAEARSREGALHPRRGLGLLRPQRRRRCRGRRRPRRPRGAGQPGAPAMDARAGAWLGAARLGDGGRDGGRARWQQGRELAPRRLEQHPQHAAAHRRRPAGRPRGRSAVRGPHAQADPDAGGRRRAQRQPDLCPAQRARRVPLRRADAGARLGAARAGRADERVRHRDPSWTSWRSPPTPIRSPSASPG